MQWIETVRVYVKHVGNVFDRVIVIHLPNQDTHHRMQNITPPYKCTGEITRYASTPSNKHLYTFRKEQEHPEGWQNTSP